MGEKEKEKIPNLADLEARRTGEAEGDFSEDASTRQALEEIAAIAEQFKQARPKPGEIPEAVDEAILSRLREQGQRIRRKRSFRRLVRNPAWAVAATVLICFSIWNAHLYFEEKGEAERTQYVKTEKQPEETSPWRKEEAAAPKARTAAKHAAPEHVYEQDIDKNGLVDIVDAYLMAKAVKEQKDSPSEWDFNRDGAVNEGDVQVVARAAVALNREGA